MNGDAYMWLDSPLTYQLGWTLVHFLWQGTLVGLGYAALRRFAAHSSPQTRYLLGLATLATLATLPVVTLLHLYQAAGAGSGSIDDAVAVLARNGASPLTRLRDGLRPLVPWTVPAWCVGVALVGARYLLGWRKARRLMQHAAQAAPQMWQQTVQRLAKKVGVRVTVQLTLTARVAAPCVVGWLKPVILLPPAALSGLTVMQLEMLLAHELAHVRRYDYLVNLLQAAIETLLFYHPVVRWVSRDVRRERELCCDDVAVRTCGDAMHYAHALADLAALRLGTENFAMAANGGDLTLRVERLLMNPNRITPAPRFNGAAFLAALCIVALLVMGYARPGATPLPQLKGLAVVRRPVAALPAIRSRPSAAIKAAVTVLRHSHVRLPMDFDDSVAQQPVAPTRTLDASPLAPAEAPPMPAARNLAPTPIPAPAGISLTAAYPDAARALDPGHASAAMQIISLNPVDNVAATGKQGTHHVYCEPLTGSRVCR